VSLNEKQRNFLINILEKASVYILIIIIVGNLLNKEITSIQLTIAIMSVINMYKFRFNIGKG
jgi:hypothetical protein